MKPYKFAPYLRTMIWGGYQIAPFKGIYTAQPNIGESWEISSVPGHESVAVERHGCLGKTEMWYVLAACVGIGKCAVHLRQRHVPDCDDVRQQTTILTESDRNGSLSACMMSISPNSVNARITIL